MNIYPGEKFDTERFFTACPLPKEYDNRDTTVQLLSHGYFKYSVIIMSPNLPPMAWTGKKWRLIK